MDFFQRSHAATSLLGGIVAALIILCAGTATASSTDLYIPWASLLTQASKNPFPPIAPFEAEYRFGWERVGAGEAKVKVIIPAERSRSVVVQGGPNAWVRSLWNYEALHVCETGENGETPSWFSMDEDYPTGGVRSEAYLNKGRVLARHHSEGEEKRWEACDLPGVRDLFSSMLFVRSQPLKNGDRLKLTVFPDKTPFLVDLTVVGRDEITVMGKKLHAIRFSLKIQTIEISGDHKAKLSAYKRFHSGRVWMSDDARRLPVRAEVDLFIGKVFAEMVKLREPLIKSHDDDR